MAEQNVGGIKLLNVLLTKIDFEIFPDRDPGKPIIVSIDVTPKFVEGKGLEERLTVGITTDDDPMKTAFRLMVTMVGLFEKQGDGGPVPLEKFSTLQAPAIMFPFVREVILSTTARASMPTIMLPPMNLAAMLRDGGGRTEIEQQ